MAALLIKNMPPPLHDKLRHRAAAHRRSMTREVIEILERELEQPFTAESLPPPVKTLKPISHEEIVQIIRDARDVKR